MRSTSLRPLAATVVLLGTLLAGCSGDSEPAVQPSAEPTPAPQSYTVDPAVDVRLLPQLAAAGGVAEAADNADWVVDVSVKGADTGALVELESQGQDGWEVVDSADLDRKGRATLLSPASGKLRVVADREEMTGSKAIDTADLDAPNLSDEFDSLDPDLWVTRAQGYVGVRTCSRADDAAASAANGVLSLSVLDDPDRNTCKVDGAKHAYRLNGHIGTQNSYFFRYGFAAARIKFQPGRGQHAAFWLQSPVGGAGGPETGGGEIDIIEYFGDGTKTGGLTQWSYWYDGANIKKSGGFVADHEKYGSDWSEKFHVFSVEWTPKEYVFRIDGKVSFRTKKGISQIPEFIVLSLLSSDYELKHQRDSTLPQTMEVDWVRVWDAETEQGTFADR